MKLIQQIDGLLDEIAAWFAVYFSTKVNAQVKRSVLKVLEEVDFTDRTITGRLKRQRALNKIRETIVSELGDNKGALLMGVKEFADKYKELVALANIYFSALSITYKKELYRELYKDSLLVLKDSLINRGFRQKVANDIVDHLVTMNKQGYRKAQMTEWVRNYLIGQNQTTRYAANIASDTLYTMTRIIQNRVSEDLNVKYWLYAGTLIKTSRTFCTNRTGRAFTTEAVKAWVSIKWDGKMAGTDTTNIFERLGGYGCRHTLRPISKITYDYINKRYEDNTKAA